MKKEKEKEQIKWGKRRWCGENGERGTEEKEDIIIKKLNNKEQTESEGLNTVSDLYVLVLVCDLFHTSLWQPTPEELINMTKKTHHILAVRHRVHVCEGERELTLVSLLVDKYYMAFHLFDGESLMLPLYTRLYHSKSMEPHSAALHMWVCVFGSVVLLGGQ